MLPKRAKLSDSNYTTHFSPSLVEAIESQFNKKKFSDFTIIAFNKEFFVHKLVIARCQYFDTLFNSNWATSSVYEFKVDPALFFYQQLKAPDDALITEESFTLTLQFLYCDYTRITMKTAIPLLATASMLQFGYLVDTVVKYIEDKWNRACKLDDLLAVADTYGVPALKGVCLIKYYVFHVFLMRKE